MLDCFKKSSFDVRFMFADVLATQGARASADMIVTSIFFMFNFPPPSPCRSSGTLEQQYVYPECPLTGRHRHGLTDRQHLRQIFHLRLPDNTH